jgi:diguanylate cyclase (GGDEF)-like protein
VLIDILMVEDNPGDARLIRELFAEVQSASFRVLQCETLTQSIELVAEEAPDVILLDLSLPDSSGLDTLRHIQAAGVDAPVVVLTGLDDEGIALEAVSEGAQDFLVKGQISASRLYLSIRHAMDRHRMQSTLRSLSLEDELTGLYNRRGFQEASRGLLDLTRRMNRKCLLVAVDMDGLKQINDQFGHQEGDKAIAETARVLRRTFRQTDLVARVGGDEFLVLAVDVSNDQSATILGKLEENIRRQNAKPEQRYSLSLSCGMVEVDPKASANLNWLAETADHQMYEQKRLKKKSGLPSNREFELRPPPGKSAPIIESAIGL